MTWLRWIWHELTRPRGGGSNHRFYRVGRSSKSGIALLVVISSLFLMILLVVDIQTQAVARLTLAAHQRDEAKAEALARSGMQIYHLVLVASKRMGKMADSMKGQAEALPPGMAGGLEGMLAGLDGDTLWRMMPYINTGLMRMIFVAGGDIDNFENELPVDEDGNPDLVAAAAAGGGLLSDEQRTESRESKGSSTKSFLDFDGDFSAEVSDEESRINIAGLKATSMIELQDDPIAQRLFAVMSGTQNCAGVRAGAMPDLATMAPLTGPLDMSDQEDHDQWFYDRDIERWELIANLADWVDADDQRIWQGGREDGLYESLDDKYLSKNAPFDTMSEIRLVDGWNNDELWDRYGENFTVYGSGKVNINTAQCEVIWPLIASWKITASHEETGKLVRGVECYRGLYSGFTDANRFISFLENGDPTCLPEGVGPITSPTNPQLKQQILNSIGAESNFFRIHSMGEVGKAVVTIDAVLNFDKSKGGYHTGKIVYWRMQ